MFEPKPMSSKDIANALISTLCVVRQIVAAWANGSIPAPVHGPLMKRTNLRSAPSFVRNRVVKGAVLYTSLNVAEAIANTPDAAPIPSLFLSGGKGIRMAGRWVRVALALLEYFELHPEEEAQIIANIKEREQGYSVNSLLKTLRARQRAARLLVKEDMTSWSPVASDTNVSA